MLYVTLPSGILSNLLKHGFLIVWVLQLKKHDEAFTFDSLLISIPSQGIWSKKLERHSTWEGRLRVLLEFLGEAVYTEVVGHGPAGKHHDKSLDPCQRP